MGEAEGSGVILSLLVVGGETEDWSAYAGFLCLSLLWMVEFCR